MAKRGVRGLQEWCKNVAAGYRDVEITNMTSSFRSGLAFCALIHRFRPDLIPYEKLNKEDILKNNDLAFTVADRELGIPALLDAEDMVALSVPDKLSVCTYVSQYYNYFQNRSPVSGPLGMPPNMTGARERQSSVKTKKTPPVEPQTKNIPPPVKPQVTPVPKPTSRQHPGYRQPDKQPEHKIVPSEPKIAPPEPKIAPPEPKIAPPHQPVTKQPERPALRPAPKVAPRINPEKPNVNQMETASKVHPKIQKGPLHSNAPVTSAPLPKPTPPPSQGTVHPSASTSIEAVKKQPRGKIGSEECHNCGRRVYLMERLVVEQRVFHRSCLRCFECNSTLHQGAYEFDPESGKFYCKNHYLTFKRNQTIQKTVQQRGISPDALYSTVSKAKSKSPSPPTTASSCPPTNGDVKVNATPSVNNEYTAVIKPKNVVGSAAEKKKKEEPSSPDISQKKDDISTPTRQFMDLPQGHYEVDPQYMERKEIKIKQLDSNESESLQKSSKEDYYILPESIEEHLAHNDTKPLNQKGKATEERKESLSESYKAHAKAILNEAKRRPPPPRPAPYPGLRPNQPSSAVTVTTKQGPQQPRRPPPRPPISGGAQGPKAPSRPPPRPPNLGRPIRRRRRMSLEEVGSELQAISVKQQQLESKGVKLESKIRSNDDTIDKDDNLMEEWFDLARQRTELFQREEELVYMKKDLELIIQHDDLEAEVRRRLAIDESLKTMMEKIEEEAMIQELVELVEKRNALVQQLEEERVREEEERLKSPKEPKGPMESSIFGMTSFYV